MPRLAGQHAEYVRTQLRGFKAGTRFDMDGNMTSAAQPLTDAISKCLPPTSHSSSSRLLGGACRLRRTAPKQSRMAAIDIPRDVMQRPHSLGPAQRRIEIAATMLVIDGKPLHRRPHIALRERFP